MMVIKSFPKYSIFTKKVCNKTNNLLIQKIKNLLVVINLEFLNAIKSY